MFALAVPGACVLVASCAQIAGGWSASQTLTAPHTGPRCYRAQFSPHERRHRHPGSPPSKFGEVEFSVVLGQMHGVSNLSRSAPRRSRPLTRGWRTPRRNEFIFGRHTGEEAPSLTSTALISDASLDWEHHPAKRAVLADSQIAYVAAGRLDCVDNTLSDFPGVRLAEGGRGWGGAEGASSVQAECFGSPRGRDPVCNCVRHLGMVASRRIGSDASSVFLTCSSPAGAKCFLLLSVMS